MSTPKQKLVVIGNGMAGARAIEDVLARGGATQFNITVFGEEPHGNYNRILLSNVLNGSQHARDIFLNPLDWYHENNVTLHAGVLATHIDRAAKIVTGANGVQEPYDKLIIATGSRPFVPPMEGLRTSDGAPKAGVFVFRTIDDVDSLAAHAAHAQRAVVIGGGLLGLEAARGLASHGAEVHVAHRSGHLMNQQLDATAGALLGATMEKMGIKVHLGKDTAALLGEAHVCGLVFRDGTTLECDMVVLACGIAPNVSLARDCGLRVERAIAVDDQMRAVDDPDVYVVGECAQHRGVVYGLVAPLWEQARVLADHLTGRDKSAAYQGSKTATKLKVMGVHLASMGVTEATLEDDEEVVFCEPKKGTYKKLVIRDGKLIGAMLLGDVSKAASLVQAFDRGTPLPKERSALLFDIGNAAPPMSAAEMPEDAKVCNCNNVSKGVLRACVFAGQREPNEVMQATRAGQGCGSCKNLVREIVTMAREEEPAAPSGPSEKATPHDPYYLLGVPLSKPELVRAIRERNLRSLPEVVRALANGDDMGLDALLHTAWSGEHQNRHYNGVAAS